MVDVKKCITCGVALNEAILRNKCKRCYKCLDEAWVKTLLETSKLNNTFSKKWTSSLLIKYYEYLKLTGIKISSIRKNVTIARKIFTLAEKEFPNYKEINWDWFKNIITENANRIKRVPISLLQFLQELEILKLPTDSDLMQERINNQIERCPKEFRRLMEIYCNTRLELRKRQINNNENKPLALKTISSDLCVFIKFAKWIIQRYKEVYSWDFVQEQHVHGYLLTLTPNNREVVRKDLYSLFKLAKSKRIVTHIPMIDYPCREFPPLIETLNTLEQKQVAKILLKNIHTNPLASFLGSLCFFHGLSTNQIQSIKISDINISCKKINLKDRPPIYLSRDELIALENYATIRAQMRNIKKKDYLVVGDSNVKIYENKPLCKTSILKKVKELTGYTTKRLRITCYHSFSEIFGPLILIDAFGLSKTQASRYGRFEEYLLEEEIKSQIQGDIYENN